MPDPTALTLTATAPGVVCDESNTGRAILVPPGDYAIESIDSDAQMAFIDVPGVRDWYVAVHTDWLEAEPTPIEPRPKAGRA